MGLIIGKLGRFDCKGLIGFQKQLEKLQNPDAFVEACAKELAARLLSKVIKRTPVGQYPENSGKTGGTLRRGWTGEKRASAKEYANSLKVNHFGDISGNCYMPPYNGITVSAAYVQLYTTVGNAENISLEVNPGAYATIGDIQDLQNRITTAEQNIEDLQKIKNAAILLKGALPANVKDSGATIIACFNRGNFDDGYYTVPDFAAPIISCTNANSPDSGSMEMKKFGTLDAANEAIKEIARRAKSDGAKIRDYEAIFAYYSSHKAGMLYNIIGDNTPIAAICENKGDETTYTNYLLISKGE